jgi:acetyl/propionyl-CoA carboxylase alpha subunit
MLRSSAGTRKFSKSRRLPFMTPELRRSMGEAAVKLAGEAGYAQCGDGRVPRGCREKLLLSRSEYAPAGGTSRDGDGYGARFGEAADSRRRRRATALHAERCYAFRPCHRMSPLRGRSRQSIFSVARKNSFAGAPAGPGIRLDDGVYEGFTVSSEYDPMLSKLISWGQDRAEAIARLQRALEEYSVTGIKTNAGLFSQFYATRNFVSGEIFTRWLDERLPQLLEPRKKTARDDRDVAAEDAQRSSRLCCTLSAKDAPTAQRGPLRKRNRAGSARRGSSRSAGTNDGQLIWDDDA